MGDMAAAGTVAHSLKVLCRGRGSPFQMATEIVETETYPAAASKHTPD